MSSFKQNEGNLNQDDSHSKEDNPFTSFYSQFLHQGNMLADLVRTGAYQQAMLANSIDFHNKVVLDVGTGTGILAFFAAQAGARFVYAVDASDSVNIAKQLAKANGLESKVMVVKGKIEQIELPGLEQINGGYVDIIVSEPIGFLLVHERMLESYIVARERFLKPSVGLMLPTSGDMILAPITDAYEYQQQLDKLQFWENKDFFGINLSSVSCMAREEAFSQAIIGCINPSHIISSQRIIHRVSAHIHSLNDHIV